MSRLYWPEGSFMLREDLKFLPVSLNVTNKRIVLIGGGKVATHKAQIIYRFIDRITVISPEFTEEIQKLPFEFIQKEYEPGDLDGAFLVYVCTGDSELNARVKQDAENRRVLASVCDAPLLCDFVSPAIYKDGNLAVAVSSNAQDVHKSIAVRDRIAQLAGEGKLLI